MCKFFSFVSDPDKPVPERFMFFDWAARQKILKGELDYDADSHTSIADYFGYKGASEDILNKYEYNPLLGKFTIDQINFEFDDSDDAESWVRTLDFKQVVEPLVIKTIIHPFKIAPPQITSKILKLLECWASVRASIEASIRASVRASIRASVGDSVWDSVRDSVWDSVWDSVRDSVWDSVCGSVRASVGDSVWDSVRDSVWDSVWAYISSFFEINYNHDFTPLIQLWEMGIVPSFDGKIWRLHGGKKATVLWEGTLPACD